MTQAAMASSASEEMARAVETFGGRLSRAVHGSTRRGAAAWAAVWNTTLRSLAKSKRGNMPKGRAFFPSLDKNHKAAGAPHGRAKRLSGSRKYAAEYRTLCELFGERPKALDVHRATLAVPGDAARGRIVRCR